MITITHEVLWNPPGVKSYWYPCTLVRETSEGAYIRLPSGREIGPVAPGKLREVKPDEKEKRK